MPKPDGSLYWYERERLNEEAAPKVEKKKAKVKKAVSLETPVSVKSETASDLSQKECQTCDESSNGVSPIGPVPIKKRSGPVPGQSKHPLMPNKGGRPTVRVKATPEMVAGICDSIRGGLSIESSCVLHGITRAGIDKWRKLNPSVNAQFEKAESDFENDMVSKLKGFASNDGKWAAWLLERRMSGRWAQVSKQELTGKDGGPQLTIAKTLVGTMGVQGDAKDAKGGKVVPMERAS